MNALRLLWAFVVRDAKIAFSYRLHFFFQASSILTVLFTFLFLSLMLQRVEGDIASLQRYGGTYFGFALVGAAFSGYFDSALRTFGQGIRQAQMTGTLEAMVATPASLSWVVAGSAAYPLMRTTFRTVLFLGFGGLMYAPGLHLAAWPAVLWTLVATLGAALACGIFSAGFIVLFKQADPVTGALTGLSWLLSGIVYPREILPEWVQRVADGLPMTHTLEAMRLALLTGATVADVGRPLAFLSGFAGFGLPLALVWFRWAMLRARITGSLAKY